MKRPAVTQKGFHVYCQSRLGRSTGENQSIYLFVCEALEYDGFPKPSGMDDKTWAFAKSPYILECIGSKYKRPGFINSPEAVEGNAAIALQLEKVAGPRRSRAERSKEFLAKVESGEFSSTESDVNSDGFLRSFAWRQVRMQALIKHGRRCLCCGASPSTGATMNVDHIKPRKLFPELALDVDNLQVLCHDCNHGKGNWDQTDWRS